MLCRLFHPEISILMKLQTLIKAVMLKRRECLCEKFHSKDPKICLEARNKKGKRGDGDKNRAETTNFK